MPSTARIEEVADRVWAVRGPVVTWVLVADDDGLTAIDAGNPASWGDLERAVAAADGTLADLRAVVLTHGHADHIGFAERARAELGAAVHAREEERKLLAAPLTGSRPERLPLAYLGQASARRSLRSLIGDGALRPKKVTAWTPLSDGDVVLVPGRPLAIATPGHTAGHTSYLLADRGVLVTGDALVTYDPYTDHAGPCLVGRGATWSSAAARESLGALAAAGDGAAVLVPGHGELWRGGVAEAVAAARAAPHG